MLNKEQVKHKIEHDSDFMRQISIKYLELGSMKAVEAHFNIMIGVVDDLFYEIPYYQKLFDEELDKQFQKRHAREGYINTLKIARRLSEVASEQTPGTEGGPTIKDVISAASTLAKLYEGVLKKKGEKSKDSLDELWDEVNSEPSPKKSIPDMPET